MGDLKKYWIALLLVIFVCFGIYLMVMAQEKHALNQSFEVGAETESKATVPKSIQNLPHSVEYERVMGLVSNSRTDSVVYVRQLIDRYSKINERLNESPNYHAAIVKLKMVETSLNVLADAISETGSPEELASYCLMINDVKPMFVDQNYFLYSLLLELGFDVEPIPMSATNDSYNSVPNWSGDELIISVGFSVKLKEYSQANGIPSAHDVLSGKVEGFDIPRNLDQYFSNKAYMQFANMNGMYKFWDGLKAYCEFKKLNDIPDESERYKRFVEDYTTDPWISKYSTYLRSHNKDKLKEWFAEGPIKRLEGLSLVEKPQ